MRIVKDPVVRKSEIIDAAIELFRKNGYEKTTVESIITQLGVAKGCFYHHFRSKDEVFDACITRLSSSIMASYASIFADESKPAKQRLKEYIDYNFQITAAHPQMFESVHSAEFDDIHARVVEESVEQILPIFVGLIEQINTEERIQGENAEFLALALLGAFQEIHQHYAHQPAMDLDKLNDWTFALTERLLQIKLR